MKLKYQIYILFLIVLLLTIGLYFTNQNIQEKINNFGRRTVVPIFSESYLSVESSYGSITAGTTTPIAVLNPQGATSTIDLFIYHQTGVATSTGVLRCGTSTDAYTAPSDVAVDDSEVATSTKAYIVNGVNSVGYINTAGTNSLDKFVVKPDEYFVCQITTSYETAYTDTTSTYDADYFIRWNRLINN